MTTDKARPALTLGSYVRTAREGWGYTQTELALLCETTQVCITRAETGKGVPAASLLWQLAAHLYLEPGLLLALAAQHERDEVAKGTRRGRRR